MAKCDILILGTGYFAEIMVNDLAATAVEPLTIVIAGRNEERLRWLETASNSRVAIYQRPVRFIADKIDFGAVETVAAGISKWSPDVVVQSASLQSPWSVDRPDSDWSKLVNAAGFGITIAFQSMLPVRTASAVVMAGSKASFVNTCYPDGVNQVLAARKLPITCGVGNIAIFSSVIAGTLDQAERPRLRVLAHHQHLVQWRKPGAERTGAPVRAWIGEQEMEGVEDRFRHIKLPFRDLNAISGASATPVLRALAGGAEHAGHVPGPGGLPGGYPVRVTKGKVELNLPAAITKQDAINWNLQFEVVDGASITADGHVRYSEQARREINKISPELAAGFHVRDLDAAYQALQELRNRMGG